MKRIVIGMSGASGAPLAIHLLRYLKNMDDVMTYLVLSDGAKLTIEQETDLSVAEVENLADQLYDNKQLNASIASGTFLCDGMIVIPCAMKTVAGIAHGYSDNLLLRACDVMIKEKRPLVIVPREAPLSPIHLDNLSYLSRLFNVTIIPPVLSYYQMPQSIEDMEIHLIGKILHIFDIEVTNYKRWQ